MTLLSQWQLSNNAEFRKKVQSAIVTAAVNVIGEATTGDPAKDLRRKNLGISVLNNSDEYVDRFAKAVTANPAISSSSSDGDIQFTVDSLWDDFSETISS